MEDGRENTPPPVIPLNMGLKIDSSAAAAAPIITVFSSAEDGFESRYEMLNEIGKGGFSVVYRCRDRQTGMDYAVKVIDLRPLRMREKFNPTRLRREVDIMRRLHHTNIIQFIAVYETPDQLLMVLEYAPGLELFDVILNRQVFSEDDARPVFVQIARAIHYLHSMNILHRDIKPENVLILHEPDPNTGLPIAKLLDFGLSKNAGASMAKTFVGTPCYLAPEVEYTSRGIGGTYGLPADCWSLGAVLHVMLVSRFPEFARDPDTGHVRLHLPPAQWDGISAEAKDLIRRLMTTNPNERMTARACLQHPWLRQYAISDQELQVIEKKSFSEFQARGGAVGIDADNDVLMNNSDENEVYMGMSMVQHARRPQNAGQDALPLAPLIQLQRSIATCFEEAHLSYKDMPEVAGQVRRGATICRAQLLESLKMLGKIDQTSTQVIDMFPDLELAVEEGEPGLAMEFFNMVKSWVVELKESVRLTQIANQASMEQIQGIVESSTLGLEALPSVMAIRDSPSKAAPGSVGRKNLEMISSRVVSSLQQMNNGLETKDLSQEEVFDVFMELFSGGERACISENDVQGMVEGNEVSESIPGGRFEDLRLRIPPPPGATGPEDSLSLSPKHAASRLMDVLDKLRDVDLILGKLGIFWANTEVLLDVLTRKSQHAEQFISFAHKPRLLARFQERMQEYRIFWENVRSMCHNYISGMKVQECQADVQGQREFEEVNISPTPARYSNSMGAGSTDNSFRQFSDSSWENTTTMNGVVAQKSDSSDSLF